MAEARFDVKVLGEPELDRALRSLTPKIEKNVLRQALRKAARPILTEARANAPFREGRLRRSIKIRALRRRRGRLGVTVQTGTRDELGISADDPYYYPAAIEFGTSHIKAVSFMRNALKTHRDEALRITSAEIWRGIEREVGR